MNNLEHSKILLPQLVTVAQYADVVKQHPAGAVAVDRVLRALAGETFDAEYEALAARREAYAQGSSG